MNAFQTNLHPPVAFLALLGEKPLLSKAETARVRDIADAERAFYEKRNDHGPRASRERVREQARSFAAGTGEPPVMTMDAATENGHLITVALREKYNAEFNRDSRPFVIGLFEKMMERGTSTHAEAVARHQKECEAFGIGFIKPPVVLSIERSLAELQKDLAYLRAGQPFSVEHQLCKKLGIAPPVAASEPLAVAA